MDVSKPHSSAVDHEHPSSIAERFVDGFMHPGLEHDAERLARGYQDLEEQLEAASASMDNLESLVEDAGRQRKAAVEQLEAVHKAWVAFYCRRIYDDLEEAEEEWQSFLATGRLTVDDEYNPASVFPAGGASVGEKNLRVGQPGHSRIMDRAIKDSNTNKGPSS